MSITLAMDVYGTLIDTSGVATALEPHVGERAAAFALLWREKQLEYTFRRGLMQNYRDFSVCVRQALDYVCLRFDAAIAPDARDALMDAYARLPVFPDVEAGLSDLRAAGMRLFAFSNGRADAVSTLLWNAEIAEHFEGIVSVDDMRSFKPNPAVYAHFLRRAGCAGEQAWMVSSNPFDVIGAVSAGMRAAWVQRSPDAIFDPWEIAPTVTVADLTKLSAAIAE